MKRIARSKTPDVYTEKRLATRRRIKRTATRKFSRRGYETTNVSDIVSELNLSQGSFYYHFPDKKSLLMEIIRDFLEKVKSLAASWAKTTETGQEAAQLFAKNMASLLYENRETARITMKESNNPDPEIRRVIEEFYKYMYEQTELGLKLGIGLGVVRPMDTRVAAVALVGMIEKVVIDSLDHRGPFDIDHVINEITNLQNFGIRPAQKR